MSLRVLHVASFSGNIGDNANHMGFRPWFEALTDQTVQWRNLEIREFYWRERKWDMSFAELANQNDLVVIGGGNYFELWVDDSPTGTSIAIPPDVFYKIRTPIFFNALGVDLGQGAKPETLNRFKGFLDLLIGDPSYLVSVRNDGAAANLEAALGKTYRNSVFRIPDAGFFCPQPDPDEKPDHTKRIAINLAGDMATLRFGAHSDKDPVGRFADEFSEFMRLVAGSIPEAEFVLVPHIFRDLHIISSVIDRLPDRLRRTRLTIAAHGNGDNSALTALSQYRSADIVLGMRFHANVCPIGLARPTLGLTCYPQIAFLYDELGASECAVDVSKPGFADYLSTEVQSVLRKQLNPNPRIMASVSALRKEFEPILLNWMDENNLTG